MCLAVPGQIVSISADDPLMRMGQVRFGGIEKEVNLTFVPDARIGNYVVVHVGFALSILDEAEAERVLEYMGQLDAAEASESGGTG